MTGRVKTLESIVKKLKKKNANAPFTQNNMEDIIGMRLTFDKPTDILNAAGEIKHNFKVTQDEDYITHPKDGYRSYHLTVEHDGKPAEIQLRTPNQTKWADWMHDTFYDHPAETKAKLGEDGFKRAKEYALAMSEYYAKLDRGEPAVMPEGLADHPEFRPPGIPIDLKSTGRSPVDVDIAEEYQRHLTEHEAGKGLRGEKVDLPTKSEVSKVDSMKHTVIYRDSLGTPSPDAAISVFGNHYGDPKGAYFSLSSVSNAPDRKWNIETPPDASYTERRESAKKQMGLIAKELQGEGWDVSIDEDGSGLPRATLKHRDTQIALESLAKRHDEKWSGAKSVYVRYGKLPPGGKSKNWADNRSEDGVSVFNGLLLPSGEMLPVPKHDQEVGSILLGLRQRPMYVVEGEVVGSGSDGEPVLRNAKLLTGKQAAKEHFPPRRGQKEPSSDDALLARVTKAVKESRKAEPSWRVRKAELKKERAEVEQREAQDKMLADIHRSAEEAATTLPTASSLFVKPKGTKSVATRIVNAEDSFIEFARTQGDLSTGQALKALESYKKNKAIKIDPIGGGYTFTHGGFAERDVLRRAAGIEDKPTLSTPATKPERKPRKPRVVKATAPRSARSVRMAAKKQAATALPTISLSRLREIEAERTKRAQAVDSARQNATVVSPSSPRVRGWMKRPGSMDVQGIDTPGRSPRPKDKVIRRHR